MNKKRIINILIIVIMLSLFIIPSSFSIIKMMNTGNSSVALATWSVSLNQNGENNYLSIVPEPENTNDSYVLSITSNSEVDITYSVIVDNLPTGVSVKADDGSFIPESNHKVMIPNVGVIRYNDENKTKQCILTFKASANATFVDEEEIDISVIISQQMSS